LSVVDFSADSGIEVAKPDEIAQSDELASLR
jgi:hypothetical protein